MELFSNSLINIIASYLPKNNEMYGIYSQFDEYIGSCFELTSKYKKNIRRR